MKWNVRHKHVCEMRLTHFMNAISSNQRFRGAHSTTQTTCWHKCKRDTSQSSGECVTDDNCETQKNIRVGRRGIFFWGSFFTKIFNFFSAWKTQSKQHTIKILLLRFRTLAVAKPCLRNSSCLVFFVMWVADVTAICLPKSKTTKCHKSPSFAVSFSELRLSLSQC